jgi:hypothetical protein
MSKIFFLPQIVAKRRYPKDDTKIHKREQLGIKTIISYII